MIDIELFLKVIFYVSLIILVVAGIALIIKVILTLKKVDGILDNVDHKANQLNGAFDIVDNVTGAINGVSGKIATTIYDTVNKFTDRKKDKDE